MEKKTVFTCSVCNTEKTHTHEFTTGYGINKDGDKVCFDCCGKQDAERLEGLPRGGRDMLYLVKNDAGKWTVSNWPGTLVIPVYQMTTGRHNIARTRTDVWFNFKGFRFWGVSFGGFTQIVHIKKVKKA